MTYSRREFLLAALSATAVPALSWADTGNSADANFSKLLDDIAEEVLRLSPTSATGLGLDKGARAGLKAQLEDLSPEGDAAWAAEVKSIASRLRAIDRKALSADAQTRYDSVAYAAESGVAGLRFPFGGAASGFNGGTAPFPVTQQDGALTRLPEFLDSQHQITDAADAEAYLARLAGMAKMLDQETARIAEQAAKGIMPPDFICRTALGQLQDFRKTAAAEQKLVTSIAERTQKQNIAGDWQTRPETGGGFRLPGAGAPDRHLRQSLGQGHQRGRRAPPAGRRGLLRVGAAPRHLDQPQRKGNPRHRPGTEQAAAIAHRCHPEKARHHQGTWASACWRCRKTRSASTPTTTRAAKS
jgi:hypothetical protein